MNNTGLFSICHVYYFLLAIVSCQGICNIAVNSSESNECMKFEKL